MARKRRKQEPKFPLPLIALGAVLIIAAALIIIFQKGRSGGGGTPALAVDKQTIDYGDVKLDTQLAFEIKVTNQGDGVLRFKEKPYIEVLEGC